MQIVRVVVAGGLLKGTEGLLQATTHNQPRQQAAALAPIRSVHGISTLIPLPETCLALSSASGTCLKMWLVSLSADLSLLLLVCPLVPGLFCVPGSCLSWLAGSSGSMFCLS